MSTDLTALLKFLRASSKSWSTTWRTVVLIAGTIWIPLIGLAAVLGRTGEVGLPAAAASSVVGLGVVLHTKRRARQTQGRHPADG